VSDINQKSRRPQRHCLNCGQLFEPSAYGERFCGETKECSDAEAEAEREAYEQRRERAQEDDYGRY
jgi:hypothetical protein